MPTAEDLTADQAAIDLAQLNVQIATQNLAAATLTSPLAGTVAAVAVTAGSMVPASSSTSMITIVAPGRYQVTTTVPLTVVDKIQVGQQATVRVDGVDASLTGTVATIGLLKSSSTTSSTVTFPVTIALDPTSSTLYTGAGASVSITIGKVDDVLTVPSSAVHTEGSRSTVTVVDNGGTSTATVTLGAIGPDRTQILSGVTAGQSVMLADLSAALPTSTASSRAGSGLGGAGAALGGAGAAGGTGGRGAGGGAGAIPRVPGG